MWVIFFNSTKIEFSRLKSNFRNLRKLRKLRKFARKIRKNSTVNSPFVCIVWCVSGKEEPSNNNKRHSTSSYGVVDVWMGEGNSKESTTSSTTSSTEWGENSPYIGASPLPKLIDATIKGQSDTVAKLLKKGKRVISQISLYLNLKNKKNLITKKKKKPIFALSE